MFLKFLFYTCVFWWAHYLYFWKKGHIYYQYFFTMQSVAFIWVEDMQKCDSATSSTLCIVVNNWLIWYLNGPLSRVLKMVQADYLYYLTGSHPLRRLTVFREVFSQAVSAGQLKLALWAISAHFWNSGSTNGGIRQAFLCIFRLGDPSLLTSVQGIDKFNFSDNSFMLEGSLLPP